MHSYKLHYVLLHGPDTSVIRDYTGLKSIRMIVSVHYLSIQNIQINLGKCIVAVYTIKNTSWINWRRLEIQLGILSREP